MQRRLPRIALVLMAVGLLILAVQVVQHYQAVRAHQLRAFDDDGERVAVPFVGTLCLGGGLFLYALTSGRKDG